MQPAVFRRPSLSHLTSKAALHEKVEKAAAGKLDFACFWFIFLTLAFLASVHNKNPQNANSSHEAGFGFCFLNPLEDLYLKMLY